MTPEIYNVDSAACLRCGACSTLAPGVFSLGEHTAEVVRPPTAEERSLCEAALINCPASAIGVRRVA